MKKSILTVAVAALALAGCTKNETVEVADSNLIGFNAFVGNATRALEDVTNETIKAFMVYGQRDQTDIFDGIKVYESQTEGVWVYDKPVQWQTATSYNFAAYSNGGLTTENASTTSTVAWDGTALTITDYNAGTEQKDLVVAVASNANDLTTSNVPVEFTFEHALSMIKFTLQSTIGDSEDATITISDFTVTGIAPNGDLSYNGTASWTNIDGTHDLENAADFTTTASKAGESDPFVVIPNTNVGFTVTFQAKLGTTGTPKTLTATISNQTFQAGYRYNYVATIDGEDMDVITFAAPEVTLWDNTEWSVDAGRPAGDLSSQN